jgi:hypothetical protein
MQFCSGMLKPKKIKPESLGNGARFWWSEFFGGNSMEMNGPEFGLSLVLLIPDLHLSQTLN